MAIILSHSLLPGKVESLINLYWERWKIFADILWFICLCCLSKLLDFSSLLMTGNELNPGDHMGGSEKQNHKLEFRKVWAIIIIIIIISNGSKSERSTIQEVIRRVISNLLGARLIWNDLQAWLPWNCTKINCVKYKMWETLKLKI